MKAKIKKSQDEIIAIVGIGCRFPGNVVDTASYWHLLENGVDAVTEIPTERLKLWRRANIDSELFPRHGGYLHDIDQFDPYFFNISPRESEAMDPQQRLLIEVVQEAFENAGLAENVLAGSTTGAFVGLWTSDYQDYLLENNRHANLYMTTGTGRYAAAGRLSYTFDLRGPCMTIDTACSSSLVAAHLACQSLLTHESDIAVAAGVNLILMPSISQAYTDAGILSPDGRCRFGDKNANGYVRSEGCGAVILKRLSTALEDNDRIYALIRGSSVNNDGRQGLFVAPTREGQKAVLRAAHKSAGIAVDNFCYFEAHGTGTPVGDPTEIDALGEFLIEQGRSTKCPIGSVKTNLGHCEAAAGVASLIKSALILYHGYIPPSLHLKKQNPKIDWQTLPVEIQRSGGSLDTATSPTAIGVNSFGITGTNAHMILAQAKIDTTPIPETKINDNSYEPLIIPLSAHSSESLVKNAANLATFVEQSSDRLQDIAYSAARRRTHHEYRTAVVAGNRTAFASRLLETAGLHPDTFSRTTTKPQKLAFVFSGQGPQWYAMGRDLYHHEPVYRKVIDECSKLLAQHASWTLSEELNASKEDSRIHLTEIGQPAIFALQMGLIALWKSWGIEADGCIGHSIGEVAAACAGGILSLENGIQVVYHRGLALASLAGCGEMAAVGLDVSRARDLIAPYDGRVCIAAVNAPQSVTISGDNQAVKDIVRALEEKGIFARSLQVGYPYHSPMVDTVRDSFIEDLNGLKTTMPAKDAYSSVTGQRASPEDYNASYWGANIRESVNFMAAIQNLIEDSYTTFLEIGPHPVLAPSITQCLEASRKKGWLAHSLRHGLDDREAMLTNLGNCYQTGRAISWENVLCGKNQLVSLPRYAWDKKSFWLNSAMTSSTPSTAKLELNDTYPEAQSISDSRIEEPPLKIGASTKAENINDLLYHIRWQELDRNKVLLSPPMGNALGIESITRHIQKDDSPSMSSEVLEELRQFLEQLEALSVEYIIRAFGNLGWQVSPGETFNKENIFKKLGITTQHWRLAERLVEILSEEGFLTQAGNELHITRRLDAADPQERLTELHNRFGDYTTELTLLSRCGVSLDKILSGRQDPLELLFPEGETDTLDRLYTDSAFSRECNQKIKALFKDIHSRWPKDKKLRVLEIGAGTGGTTAHILPLLTQSSCEYVFTDVSTLFLNRAESKFQSYPFVYYRRLDISRPPGDQGFDDHSFDLIVAANVMHATADLRQSLRHAHTLLADSGMLIMLEGTTPRRWIDLIFGLLEGWWLFSDKDIRPNYPLVDKTDWPDVLQESGYNKANAIPVIKYPESALFDQALIVAEKESIHPDAEQKPVVDKKSWLVFSDSGDNGKLLVQNLCEAGDECVSVHRGDTFTKNAYHNFTLCPSCPEDYDAVLAEAQQAISKPIDGLIYLWGLDIPTGSDLKTAAGDESPVFGCGSLLYLVHALGRNQQIDVSRLYVVTRGTQFIDSASVADRQELWLLQACLWGMGRVIRLEYPDLNCTLIDLDPSEEHTDSDKLTAELRLWSQTAVSEDSESQIAIRSNGRYAARLVQNNHSFFSHKSAENKQEAIDGVFHFPDDYFHSDCSYLITGGYGGIGLLTAEWMIQNGAKFLVLVGRTGASEIALETITAFEQKGAQVLKLQGDVSAEQDVQKVLSAIQSEFPPLKGIIHAAGVLEDGVIEQQTWDRFEKVLSPKIGGAWHLHRHTRNMELAFFIMYSSWASIMGSAGQVNHSAANAFLDTLAQYREASGLPTISINWGPWSGQGAAAQSDIGQKLASRGIENFTPRQGLQALGQILLGRASQMTVMPLNLDRWFETYPSLVKSSFFTQLIPAEPVKSVTGNPSVLNNTDSPGKAADIHQLVLEAASIEQQISALQHHLRNQLAVILRIPLDKLDSQKSFKDLGLDSLTGLELRNRINLHLSITLGATAVWNYPTIDQLAAHISSLINKDVRSSSSPDPATNMEVTGDQRSEQELAMLLDELDGLSEDDVRRLLFGDTKKGGAADE